MKTIGIIGFGKVGQYLAHRINTASDLQLMWVCSAHLSTGESNFATTIYNNVKEIAELPDITIISTLDKDIIPTAALLVEKFTHNLANHLFLHTSGSNGSGILFELTKYGASIAAAHPFQTISTNSTDLQIPFAVECDKADALKLKELIFQLGGSSHFLSHKAKQNKPLYHAVSVAASNYVRAAIELSKQLADEVGIDHKAFLQPILQQTVRNAFDDKEITGPIARNDVATIQKHILSLSDHPTLLNSYAHFAIGLLELLHHKGSIAQVDYDTLHSMLTHAHTNSKKNSVEKIILGLGNYGGKYMYTRHNIGFVVTSNILLRCDSQWITEDGIADYAEVNIAGHKIVLARPLTYMNNSGKAAKWLLDKYKLFTDNLLVIVDEYNFPIGKVHLKTSGSDGKHNGVASVIKELGTTKFHRLRCGIDKNFGPNQLVEYVLSPFSPEEQASLYLMLNKAVEAVECYVKNGRNIGLSMSIINSMP
ncbi:MAG: aminoacyl-tRNA hydrolase [Ignavibacteria bacterium]|jgi:PTH1 family peptidyl-tRNA hydrolase|nr:aminoacyl-tRNA hydrolase [Ignavibacteria bacterium]